MRKITVFLLPLCVLYFLIGLVLVWLKAIEFQTYLNGAGIVGAIASVLGLLSFARSPLEMSDIQNIEAESLSKLGEISSEIKNLEKEKVATATEISNLEIQKKKMELLVRKASMALFLRDQHQHHEQKILNHLKNEPEISLSINELLSVDQKLKTLDEEIDKDENVELLKEVMSLSETPTYISGIDRAIANASTPGQKLLLRVLKIYIEPLQNIARVLFR